LPSAGEQRLARHAGTLVRSAHTSGQLADLHFGGSPTLSTSPRTPAHPTGPLPLLLMRARCCVTPPVCQPWSPGRWSQHLQACSTRRSRREQDHRPSQGTRCGPTGKRQDCSHALAGMTTQQEGISLQHTYPMNASAT
jgi:hypothetical protein